MFSKKSTKKVSFLLAASLLTAALPATTQAGWKIGTAFGALGAWCALGTKLTWEKTKQSLILCEKIKNDSRTAPLSTQTKLLQTAESDIRWNFVDTIFNGVLTFICLNISYKNFFSKKNAPEYKSVGTMTEATNSSQQFGALDE